MGSHKIYLRVILSIVIALAPVFIINSANAATLGGWTIGGLIADGASSIVNGTKTVVINGANVVKTSTARITPSVASVSKLLARGAAGYALSIAVEQLLGAVDWVLDPENNQIKYYNDGNFLYSSAYAGMDITHQYSTLNQLCNAALAAAKIRYAQFNPTSFHIQDNKCYVDFENGGSDLVPFSTVQAETEEKTLSLDVVAQQVIDNAENSSDSDVKAGAQVATVGAAEDMLANNASTQSDVEQQLNTNAQTQTSEQATGETKPNEANPGLTDISLDFPAFCGWAPTICEAANVVINFPTTLTNWWDKSVSSFTSAYEYAKTKVQAVEDYFKEEPNDDTELNIEDPIQQEPDTTITFSTACPEKIPLIFDWNGRTLDFSFDFTIWCNATSTYLKPVVVALGSLHALYIVAGVREDG